MLKSTTNPEWINLFDKFKSLDYGDIVTYEEMNRLLREGNIRKDKRYVFDKFKKEMLHQEQKCLENVINKGYRIINPNEHVRVSSGYIRKAERNTRKSVDNILNTNMSMLTDEEAAIARLAATRIQPVHAALVGERRALKEESRFELPHVPKPV